MATQGPVYRKAALDKLSSPEELDRLLQIIRPGAWLLLGGFGAVLLMVVVWGIFGQIDTTAEHAGILTLSNPVLFVNSPETGLIFRIDVSEGDIVNPDDTIAQVITANGTVVDVTSTIAGRVVSIRVDENEPVDSGTPILSLESFERTAPEQEVVLYVLLEERQQLDDNMSARILPSTVEREKYGYLEGRVVSVAEFAATREEVVVALGDESFADSLFSGEQIFEVRIALDRDDQGDYVWTASDGPSAAIVSGTPCLVLINLDSERPISRVLRMR